MTRFAKILPSLFGLFVVAAGHSAAIAGSTTTLTVQGTIAPSCGLAGPGGTVDLGDITTAGSHQFSVTVTCNTPFAYAVVSANQALKIIDGPAIVGGNFSQTVPYTLTTSFQTDGGSFGNTAIPSTDLTDANAAPCLAASYDALGCSAHFTDSGSAIAIDKPGTLTVQWGTPAHTLVGGTFTDTITLTLRVI